MIKQQISQLIQDAHDGNESAAKTYAMLKEIQSVIESGLKVISSGALDEARQFNKGDVYYGGVWEVRNTPVYLDFSKDQIFTSLNSSAQARKKLLNQAYKQQEGQAFFDKESGEEIPILPVKTASKETVIFKPKS